jgi:hypothetical protein
MPLLCSGLQKWEQKKEKKVTFDGTINPNVTVLTS